MLISRMLLNLRKLDTRRSDHYASITYAIAGFSMPAAETFARPGREETEVYTLELEQFKTRKPDFPHRRSNVSESTRVDDTVYVVAQVSKLSFCRAKADRPVFAVMLCPIHSFRFAITYSPVLEFVTPR